MKKILMALLIFAMCGNQAFGKKKELTRIIMSNSPGGEEINQFDCRDVVYIDFVFKAEKGESYLAEARWINNGEEDRRFQWKITGNHAYAHLILDKSFKGRLLSIGGFTDKWRVEVYIDGEFLAEKFFYVSC